MCNFSRSASDSVYMVCVSGQDIWPEFLSEVTEHLLELVTAARHTEVVLWPTIVQPAFVLLMIQTALFSIDLKLLMLLYNTLYSCVPGEFLLSFPSRLISPLFWCFPSFLRQLQRSAHLCQRRTPPPRIKQAPPLPPKMELLPQQPIKPLHQRAQLHLLALLPPPQPKSPWVWQTCSHTDIRVHTRFGWCDFPPQWSVFLCRDFKWFSLGSICIITKSNWWITVAV